MARVGPAARWCGRAVGYGSGRGMQIVYQIGANGTDCDRLLRSLLRDAGPLGAEGVAVPEPELYRKFMQGAVAGIAEASLGGDPAPAVREQLVAQVLGGQEVRRLVLGNPAFLAWNRWVFARGVLYPRAAAKVASLDQLFPDDEIELCLALRNPATFIPAIWRMSDLSWDELTRGLDPLAVRWSDVVARIAEAAPRARLRIWCNEDLTFVWGTLLRLLAGVEPGRPMAGEFDFLAGVIAHEGMQRFRAYLQSHPGQSEMQVRRVIGAFLDKYALSEAVEEEVDAPDWDAAVVTEITRAYDEDVARIAKMPGVDFIAP
jgi:hypothetical protein